MKKIHFLITPIYQLFQIFEGDKLDFVNRVQCAHLTDIWLNSRYSFQIYNSRKIEKLKRQKKGIGRQGEWWGGGDCNFSRF